MNLVSEAMNRSVVAVSPDASTAEAVALARREHAEHVLVLEGGDSRDPVSERMSLPVLTIRPDATLEDAALTLCECEVGCLAVACGGLVLGTLGEEDLARVGVGPHPGRHHRHHGRRGNMPHA